MKSAFDSTTDVIAFDFYRSTLGVMQNEPFTIISKYVISTTPLWVYVVSIIFGILSLILISYAMYKVSRFFFFGHFQMKFFFFLKFGFICSSDSSNVRNATNWLN